MDKKIISGAEFTRLANNFYNSQNMESSYERIVIDADLGNYVVNHKPDLDKVYKVGFMWICINPPYWQYAKDMVEGARKFFLPGHEVEYMLWSDMPDDTNYGCKVFQTDPVEWPYPTLLRYNLFLQQEEYLKKFDYLFYCDVDMKFVDVVGDEILGNGLTAVQHPMYALRKEFQYPFEPNPESKAYVNNPKYYYAGGFQGGKTEDFIKAMKVMKKNIDADFSKNYIARWNDESHWNNYLLDKQPSVILSPSYVYPDSLINEYYIKLWGRNYKPRLVTLTKKFATNKEGGQAIQDMLKTL